MKSETITEIRVIRKGVVNMMILILVLVGFAVYYFVKNSDHTESKSNKKDSIELLKLRFVNGEIDEETYKRTLEVLKG